MKFTGFLQTRSFGRQIDVSSKTVLARIWNSLKRLEPKILLFTFGASLLPIIFLLGLAWRFVYQPLTELEKTRLNDQVLAFRGYTSATAKGLENLGKSYAIWTALYDAMAGRDRTWIKTEVTEQLTLSTDIDTVWAINLRGEILGQKGKALGSSTVQKQLKTLTKAGKSVKELIALSDRQLLMLVKEPVFRTDNSGTSPGNLIIGKTLNDTWLQEFLNFTEPTTRLDIISLTGTFMLSSQGRTQLDDWEKTNLDKIIIPAIKQGELVYRIEPNSGHNKIYAGITSEGKPIAIVKIQITSEYFQQASIALNCAILMGLGLAIILSIALGHLLARQIGQPINQLAKRSKTLATGDLDSPIPGIDAGGEIGQLANAYQEMAQAIKSLINNLEHRVAQRTLELELSRQTLEEKVQERTEELSSKNQQLQQASEQLSEAIKTLKKAQAQLVQTEKMSSLGQLVAGIAHEINNPVNFIYANLFHVSNYTRDLLELMRIYQERYFDAEIQQQIEAVDLAFIIQDLPKTLSSMQNGAERISKIVLTLRNFSRLDEDGLKRVNIHDGIDSTLLILQNRFRSTDGYPEIKIIKKYGELPLIQCYPRQMNQAFMNIIGNAIDALHESLIKGQLSEENPPLIIIQTQKVNSDAIKVIFWNNGLEISPEIQGRIFDPFFTTKSVGKGTGLGLSICYQIVQKHEGNIEVFSAPGQGTEFAITLPLR